MKKLLTYIVAISIVAVAASCSFDSKPVNKTIPNQITLAKVIKSKSKIVVAVIDTGADLSHDDLKGSLWTGKNGQHGWNFVDNNSDVSDDMGHGTHIAGIIRSTDANISLMILKYYSSRPGSQKNAYENSLKAIRYAIDNGANIINYSGGGEGASTEEFELLREAESKGIIVVSAAGNESSDMDAKPYYPASYRLSNIITVASVDANGKLSHESNYGSVVDATAPGEDIYSSLPGNEHGYMTGTSQATAYVTAQVATAKSLNPKWNYKRIKQTVLASLTSTAQKNIYLAKALSE